MEQLLKVINMQIIQMCYMSQLIDTEMMPHCSRFSSAVLKGRVIMKSQTRTHSIIM